MTQQQHDQLKRLFKLAELSQEFEHLNLELVDLWCTLREELGLAKLLLLTQTYVEEKTQPYAQTSQIEYANQNTTLVQ